MDKFIKTLKKNELFFIDEKYVIFYELDVNTIYGLNNNVHKTKGLIKFFTNYMSIMSNFAYFNFYSKNINTYNYKYSYAYYFLTKFNKTIKIKNNFWKEFYNYKIISFHHFSKKLRLIISKNNKMLINFSSGMATKKLGIEEKKNKKSLKIFNIMIKSILKNIKPKNRFFRCIIQFKGSNSFINKYLETLDKLNFNFKEAYIMYTPKIPKKFKFKKIRSLKKNFRKNYLLYK